MHDQKELLIALSGEPNAGRLLERILSEAQAITHADGGTLYLLRDNDGVARLEFALMRNASLKLAMGGTAGAIGQIGREAGRGRVFEYGYDSVGGGSRKKK